MEDQDEIKKIIMNGCTFVFGVALLALTYNLFLYPYNLVVGGMSGLAVICEKSFGWNATLFIYITSFLLLIISYIFLGKEETRHTIVGSILYPIMISITTPIAQFILTHFDIQESVIIVLLAGAFYGFSSGLIYRAGFTTGGGDVIMQLMSKYLNISTSKSNFLYSFLIIFLCAFVFGISSFVNAIILLLVSNFIINKIIIGISNSKVFFICTEEKEKMKDIIKNEYHSGFTILNSKSGFANHKSEVIMVVIANRYYHKFKNHILDIDPSAFFVINDCYEVNGGVRRENIPYF